MSESRFFQAGQEAGKKFGTDLVKGLTDAAVRENRAKHGANRLTPPEKDPLWKQWLEKFEDPTIIILCVCAAIALILGAIEGQMPWDGVAILVAVCLATAGGTWSEYKADKAFELLKKDSDNIMVKVTRNGQFHTIANNDVVAGDLIHLETGDKVPADAVLIQSVDLMLDQSLMTGESEPVHKGAQDAELTGGTQVALGSGLAIVTAVGDNTKLGNLASSLGQPYVCPNPDHRRLYRKPGTCEVAGCGQELEQHEEGQTPLQKKLAGLADQISVWGTIAAVFIFIALMGSDIFARMRDLGVSSFSEVLSKAPLFWPQLVFAVLGALGLKILSLEEKAKWMIFWGIAVAGVTVACWLTGNMQALNQVLRFFMVAVTIIVVAVPEGLPLAIFIALGLGMRKIREDNNLVRKMVATETIGSSTVICSDKTGTLTKNRMAVAEIYFAGKSVKGNELSSLKGKPGFDLLATSCVANSTAEIEHVGTDIRYIGSATEGALLLWLEQMGINYQEGRGKLTIHARACFSTERKMMSSVTGGDACAECVSCPLANVGADETSVESEKAGCRMIFTKGAPEKVFEKCSHVYVGSGRKPMSSCQAELRDVVDKMAARAVRPLAICYKVCKRKEVPHGQAALEATEKDLTLLAIVGINDEVREDVPQAIAACHDAGIEVKMITGDHPLTAQAVAKKVGMMHEGDIAVTEEEFDAMSDEKILAILPRLRILSRAKPVEGKKRLVELLQRAGHVVAVTGDGVNDVPALKTADVGIAMGMKGTEVAKEASDIILTDDNFGSIVRAVHWGRTLYENLQKFLQFQLTVNLSALGIAFISPIVGTLFPNAGFSIQPLTVLQYLWINLIMDTLAAIAFGLEPPRTDAMRQKPRSSKEPFLTKTMLTNIIVMGSYFIGLLLVVQATDLLGLNAYESSVSPQKFALMKASLVFNAYVFFQIFQMFNARSVMPGRSAFTNITKSRSFFYVMGFVVLMQIALIQFGGVALNTTNLPLSVWGRIIALGASAVVVGEVLRFVQRLMTKAP